MDTGNTTALLEFTSKCYWLESILLMEPPCRPITSSGFHTGNLAGSLPAVGETSNDPCAGQSIKVIRLYFLSFSHKWPSQDTTEPETAHFLPCILTARSISSVIHIALNVCLRT